MKSRLRSAVQKNINYFVSEKENLSLTIAYCKNYILARVLREKAPKITNDKMTDDPE